MDMQPSTDAVRAKRYRARQRNGMRVFNVEANEDDLAQALVAARIIKPENVNNPLAIEHGVQKLMNIFISKDE